MQFCLCLGLNLRDGSSLVVRLRHDARGQLCGVAEYTHETLDHKVGEVDVVIVDYHLVDILQACRGVGYVNGFVYGGRGHWHDEQL